MVFATALFTITNPLGNTAIFASMTGGLDVPTSRRVARQSALAITVVLLAVLWLGHALLDFFGVNLPALQTAGGLIVLLLGLSMLHNQRSGQGHSDAETAAAAAAQNIAVVPVAMPIVAGPGAITTVLLAASKQAGQVVALLEMSLVCLAFGALFWLCFRSAARVADWLGVAGVAIVTRIMGMILAAIAVGMMAEGIRQLLPGLA